MNQVRNRIKQLRMVAASDLIPNVLNYRKHPERQRTLLKQLFSEIGYADALLAREEGGKLHLIDGHLRAETTPDQEVPVLILDVTKEEANKLLLTLDPLAALAETDDDLRDSLLSSTSLSGDLEEWLSPGAEKYKSEIVEWDASAITLKSRFSITCPIEMQPAIREMLATKFPEVQFDENILQS